MDRMNAEMRFANRHDKSVGLLFIDIDHFKKINDAHGHQAGDSVLAGVAHAMRRWLGGSGLCIVLALGFGCTSSDQLNPDAFNPVGEAGNGDGEGGRGRGGSGGMECLRRCLEQLPPENRKLILHYYQGEKDEKIKNRKGLMEVFGVPASTLRMRALRLREGLHLCSENCVQRQEGTSL